MASVVPRLIGLAASAFVAAAHGADAGFNGSAYLKTRHTVLYADKPYGMARAATQGLVDQCNRFRDLAYKLPPVAPSDSVMASLDVFIHEKTLDRDKALSVVTGTHLILTDMRRWVDEMKASANGAFPAVPPDCAQAQQIAGRNGTLWRDGLVYELRYDTRKAIGRRAPLQRGALMTPADFINLPAGRELGQSCREVTGGPSFAPGSHACIWDLFPYASHLNWPFALSGRVQFGPTPALFETIVPIEARHGESIPSSTFEIPAGFAVTAP